MRGEGRKAGRARSRRVRDGAAVTTPSLCFAIARCLGGFTMTRSGRAPGVGRSLWAGKRDRGGPNSKEQKDR